MKTEVEAAYEFRKNSRRPRHKVMKRLAVMRKQGGGDTASISSSESAVLPKLDLTTFSGAMLRVAIVLGTFPSRRSHMPEITKLVTCCRCYGGRPRLP